MKASLTESDYQLIQKLEIKRAEEQKEPLTALCSESCLQRPYYYREVISVFLIWGVQEKLLGRKNLFSES